MLARRITGSFAATSPLWRGIGDLARLPARELQVSWRFIRNDVWAGVLPGICFTLVALRQGNTRQLSAAIAVRAVLASALYFWLYLYGHTLANQIEGVEEDRINKPDRPLPSGLVTLSAARIRLVVFTALFLAVGAWLGVFRWALLWTVTYLLLNFYGHRHWFLKNSLPMSAGALAMLCAAWEIVLPMTAIGWQTVLTIAGFVALTSPIQDFRDIDGDRVMERKTLPISLGERPARLLIGAALLAWIPVAFVFLMRPAISGPMGKGFAISIVILEVLIAVRILTLRGPKPDHKTYRLYEQLYCLYVFAAFAFLA